MDWSVSVCYFSTKAADCVRSASDTGFISTLSVAQTQMPAWVCNVDSQDVCNVLESFLKLAVEKILGLK